MDSLTPLGILKHNLLLGYRLASGKRLRGLTFIFDTRALLLLLAFIALLETLLQWLTAPAASDFNIYGASRLASLYLLDGILLLGLLLFVSHHNADASRLLIGYASCLPPQMIVSQAYEPILELTPWREYLQWIYIVALILWLGYILTRLMQHLFNLALLKRASLAFVFIAATIFFSLLIPRQDLWIEKEQRDGRYQAWYSLNPERIFYAQPGLLEQALDTLKPHRPGLTDLYLLTFAGYGHEDVFLNEVEYVSQYFDQHFATRNRSLLLANNLKTVEQHPLANYHNLVRALKSIASRIDPAEDMVFLFMTSHGSENFRFSVKFGSIRMNDLSPQDVRRAFDEAGIEWRVIVVSSCYSGGFIEPLESARSLVITASAPTATSFGCGAESSFTWFGTAYFKQGLAQTDDFIEAFTIAREWVEKKEKQDKIEASDPRMFVGEEIREKLERLRLDRPSLHSSLRH